MIKIPNKTDLEKHEWIKASLRIRGTSFAKLAREIGVSTSALSMVSSGKYRSKKIENAIASALNCEPENLWPTENKAHGMGEQIM